jgi:exodeoxyribonuclease-3
MKVMSFNVNGIRARMDQLSAVLMRHTPDIIGLQETKVEDALFPRQELADMGYQAVYHGQKGHYGVALLYRNLDVSATSKGFVADGDEAQCRLVSATFNSQSGPVTVYNGYFPQGENRSHPTKFANKNWFYRSLLTQLNEKHTPKDRVILMGDMNVAPFDRDIGIGDDNRKRWLRDGKCCFLPEEREWLSAISQWGLFDTLDIKHPGAGEFRYSWFDYRSKGFEREPKRGLRIDLVMATQPLCDALRDAGVDQNARAMERPSDHCPVWAQFDQAL